MPPSSSVPSAGVDFLHSLLDPEVVLGRIGDGVANSFTMASFWTLLATLMVCKWTYQYSTWDRVGERSAKLARRELQAKQREIRGEVPLPLLATPLPDHLTASSIAPFFTCNNSFFSHPAPLRPPRQPHALARISS
jgi:hypothetical protein